MTSLLARVTTLLQRLGGPRVTALATGVLVVIGIIAAATDHLGLAVIAVLLIQAILLLAVISGGGAGSTRRLERRIDQASARTLADLSKVRQQLLAAVDETRAKE